MQIRAEMEVGAADWSEGAAAAPLCICGGVQSTPWPEGHQRSLRVPGDPECFSQAAEFPCSLSRVSCVPWTAIPV